MTSETDKNCFEIMKDITNPCPLQREPSWKHISNGDINILPCKYFRMGAIFPKSVYFTPS